MNMYADEKSDEGVAHLVITDKDFLDEKPHDTLTF